MSNLPTDSTGPIDPPESGALEALPPKVREAIETLPEEARSVVVAHASVQHSGPLPHPRLVREYDEIVPGAGERLLKMVEKQEDHRIDWESKALEYAARDKRRGHWLGACVTVIGLLGAIALAVADKVVVGVALGIGSPLAALVANRLFAMREEKPPRED